MNGAIAVPPAKMINIAMINKRIITGNNHHFFLASKYLKIFKIESIIVSFFRFYISLIYIPFSSFDFLSSQVAVFYQINNFPLQDNPYPFA